MKQAERVALSDTRMLEAAIELVNEVGTHNTLLKEVGELAGYSRGLASNRFGSKEALFLALVNYCHIKWREELLSFLEGRSGIAAFLASLDAVQDFLLNQPKYLRAMYIIWYESICSYKEVRDRLAAHHNDYRKEAAGWLKDAIRDGHIRSNVDVDIFAANYRSFLSGTIYQWLINMEAMDVKLVFSEFRKMSLLFLTGKPSR